VFEPVAQTGSQGTSPRFSESRSVTNASVSQRTRIRPFLAGSSLIEDQASSSVSTRSLSALSHPMHWFTTLFRCFAPALGPKSLATRSSGCQQQTATTRRCHPKTRWIDTSSGICGRFPGIADLCNSFNLKLRLQVGSDLGCASNLPADKSVYGLNWHSPCCVAV